MRPTIPRTTARREEASPGWLEQAKPPAKELLAVLDIAFEHVLPAHGEAVVGGARAAFEPALRRAAATRA